MVYTLLLGSDLAKKKFLSFLEYIPNKLQVKEALVLDNGVQIKSLFLSCFDLLLIND